MCAFAFLGIALLFSFVNPRKAYVQTWYKSQMPYTAVYGNILYIPEGSLNQSLGGLLGVGEYYEKDLPVSVADAERLRSASGGTVCLVYKEFIYSFQKNMPALKMPEFDEIRAESDDCFAITASGYMAIEESECSRLGFTVAGRLPNNSAEIAINECMFNTYTVGGLVEDGITYSVQTTNDIIGHKISVNHNTSEDNFKTIVGVVDTGCDKLCGASHIEAEDSAYYHEKIFVSEDYFSEYTFALVSLPAGYSDFTAFADFVLDYNNNGNLFRFSNKFSKGYYFSVDDRLFYGRLSLVIGFLFLAVAFVLLVNFVAASMRSQMKQIGTLASLGAGLGALCKIYCGSALILGGIVFMLSTVTVGICTQPLNALMVKSSGTLFDLVTFSPFIPLILAVSVAAAVLAGSVVPLLRMRKKTPIEIMAKGQIK